LRQRFSCCEGAAPTLQAPHGSGALMTAVHCFRIVFSIHRRFGGMHFCLVARRNQVGKLLVFFLLFTS
jgi:hypothetical protein